MQIATRKVYDVLGVEVTGRLDSRTAGEAGDRVAQIAAGPDKQVVLNLGGLTYCSSAGLRVILRLAKLLQANGGVLKICDARDEVALVLETSGFDSLLSTYPAEKDAVAAFAAG